MPRDRRNVEQALEKKGFVRSNRDHKYYLYHTKEGKKSPIRTHTSHGSGYKTLDDHLVSQMARQCKLTKKQFENLIDCPLDRSGYEEILVSQGAI